MSEEKMQLNIDNELPVFIETILEHCEFLAACKKSGMDIEKEIKEQIIKKFKITNSEISFTSEEMLNLLEDINANHIYKAMLDLSTKGFLNIGLNEEGEMTFEATELTKDYIKLFQKNT